MHLVSLLNLSSSRYLQFCYVATFDYLHVCLLLPIFKFCFTVSDAIRCFECSSVNDNYCPDTMNSDDEDIVELKDCGSSLYEAQYCIKTTGVEGGIFYLLEENDCKLLAKLYCFLLLKLFFLASYLKVDYSNTIMQILVSS